MHYFCFSFRKCFLSSVTKIFRAKKKKKIWYRTKRPWFNLPLWSNYQKIEKIFVIRHISKIFADMNIFNNITFSYKCIKNHHATKYLWSITQIMNTENCTLGVQKPLKPHKKSEFNFFYFENVSRPRSPCLSDTSCEK